MMVILIIMMVEVTTVTVIIIIIIVILMLMVTIMTTHVDQSKCDAIIVSSDQLWTLNDTSLSSNTFPTTVALGATKVPAAITGR